MGRDGEVSMSPKHSMEMGPGTERQKMQGRVMGEIRAGHDPCRLDWEMCTLPRNKHRHKNPHDYPTGRLAESIVNEEDCLLGGLSSFAG